jgi:hypothetical protein
MVLGSYGADVRVARAFMSGLIIKVLRFKESPSRSWIYRFEELVFRNYFGGMNVFFHTSLLLVTPMLGRPDLFLIFVTVDIPIVTALCLLACSVSREGSIVLPDKPPRHQPERFNGDDGGVDGCMALD